MIWCLHGHLQAFSSLNINFSTAAALLTGVAQAHVVILTIWIDGDLDDDDRFEALQIALILQDDIAEKVAKVRIMAILIIMITKITKEYTNIMIYE